MSIDSFDEENRIVASIVLTEYGLNRSEYHGNLVVNLNYCGHGQTVFNITFDEAGKVVNVTNKYASSGSRQGLQDQLLDEYRTN